MARSIAVVGAGQAGLQLGIGLLEKGFAVTLVAVRSADEVFHGRLTATAGLFATALSYEAELGLDLWAGQAPLIDGVHIDFCIEPRNLLLSIEGAFEGPCRAIDHRLKLSTWMREFERRGGRLIVRAATVADLDELAAEHDAVFVAAGKAALSSIFPRDEARSVFTEPARNLAAFTLSELRPWEGIPFENPAKFTVTAGVGEIFWIPFLGGHGEHCFSVVVEGVPGSCMDRFQEIRDPREALAAARAVIAEIAPWETGTLAQARMIDDLAWSPGALSCVVRHPVALLPSGRAVFGLGDTVAVFDPVSAQGANNAAKMAHGLTCEIAGHGSEPLDAAWMTDWFDGYWERHARHMAGSTASCSSPWKPRASRWSSPPPAPAPWETASSPPLTTGSATFPGWPTSGRAPLHRRAHRPPLAMDRRQGPPGRRSLPSRLQARPALRAHGPAALSGGLSPSKPQAEAQ